MNDGKFKLALVKISNGEVIPDDEPVFFLRARDEHALETLIVYRTVCEEAGCNDYQMAGIDAAIERFELYRISHPDKMKQPGVTRGA